MATNSVLRRLWRPPAETLEALGSVLGAHWRAAARTKAARLFGATTASWLRGRVTARAVVRVTTSPPVAGSSDTRRDPRPY
jgi:hypothetical protein